MGGGASNGACFRPLTRCDEVGVNVFKTLLIDFVEKKPHTLSKGEGAVVRAKRATNVGGGSSRRENNCNNFPLSIFNFPFIQKENRRVRFNAPQPTTKEVLC